MKQNSLKVRLHLHKSQKSGIRYFSVTRKDGTEYLIALGKTPSLWVGGIKKADINIRNFYLGNLGPLAIIVENKKAFLVNA